MRKLVVWSALALAVTLPVACVTINVYFPAAAAEKAAEQFVGKVFGDVPEPRPNEPQQQPEPEPQPERKPPGAMMLDLLISSAHAQTPDISIQTPQIQAIQSRMRQRFDGRLAAAFASGAIGLTRNGEVAIRDAAAVPLAERAALNHAVADDNRDRQAVYREIAIANNHPEWEAQIRETFAKQWLQQARPGWYYQDASGAWKQK